MRRRLDIGIALPHEPKIVILDEPTVRIDPRSRRRILDGFAGSLIAAGTAALCATAEGTSSDGNIRIEIMRRRGDWAQSVG